MQAIFATYGDVAFVPIVWYWPKAASDPTQLDIVPMPGAGNTLVVRPATPTPPRTAAA